MSPYSWRPSNYQCPGCETRLESKAGPDGLNAQRCPNCEWWKVYDPAADEFATNELERVTPVTDGGRADSGQATEREHLAYNGICPVCDEEFIDGFDPLEESESYDGRICVVEKNPETGDGQMLVHLEEDTDE